ncbi:MAG TPA: PP2C family protein-serine/threonine phosphatase [Vicinamibacterales bacterium]
MNENTAGRAGGFFEVYTRDLKASDLQRLFTRDAREAYEFFSRGVDRTGLANLPWHVRLWTHVKLFFIAFTLRLSPARRALYGIALAASIIGLLKLFSGVDFIDAGGIVIPFPIPVWHDGTLFLAVGFVLLNLLIILEVADRLSLKNDLNVARDIQLAMLPQGTFRAPGLEVHGQTRPANTVGGDFYDMIPLPDGRLIVALGDVAGKGSPAALLMALLLAMLRTLVDEGLEPGPLLDRLNAQVLRHAPRSRFVTLFLAVISPDGRMQWVNAGQNPPHLRRADGSVRTLDATGVALGMFEGSRYEASEEQLCPGDMLVAYSDGITEAENVRGEPFDESGLDSVLTAWVTATAPELCDALIRAVTAHVGEARFTDDLTVLVLRKH